jgi:hypothetical protein
LGGGQLGEVLASSVSKREEGGANCRGLLGAIVEIRGDDMVFEMFLMSVKLRTDRYASMGEVNECGYKF